MEDDSLVESTSRTHGSHLHPGHAHATPQRRSSRNISSERSLSQSGREQAYDELLDDSYSIGNVSIEPGMVAEPSQKPASKRKSLKSLRSARSLRSLVMKNSRDSLAKSEIYVHPDTNGQPELKHERLFIPDSPSPSPSPRDLTVKRRDIPVDAFDLLHGAEDLLPAQPTATSQRLYLDSEDTWSSGPSQSKRSSYNFPRQDHIPVRDSSRRHSSNFLHQRRRSRNPRSEHSAAPESENEGGDEQFHTPPSTPPPAINELDEAGVNRRIEELKEQKAKRDQLSAGAPSEALSLPVRTSRPPSPSLFPEESMLERDTTSVKISESSDGILEASMSLKEREDTAPSPTIPQRTLRDEHSRVNSVGHKPTIARHSPAASRDDNNSGSIKVPQRSNSKLLKRLSQAPTHPSPGEKPRRRFSNPLGHTPTNRNTSYQTDSGDSIDASVSDYLSSARLSQKITHPQTGRLISFSEVGDPNGSVVFCCVGMGLTRYITAFYDELAATLKLRLITPERPGVGNSEPHTDGKDTPLAWPDDVRTICEHRGITKFSIMAHSAGAIYALATALRMPQHIRCRVHLLGPWIPPSQMSAIGTHQEPLPATAMPYSQRVLRSLPTTFLRAANSSFLTVTSNSFTTSLPRSSRRSKRSANKNIPSTAEDALEANWDDSPSPKPFHGERLHMKENRPSFAVRDSSAPIDIANDVQPREDPEELNGPDREVRRTTYESRLASSIWEAATKNANPAVDLLVCLERHNTIGFRYVDITRPVVIHHGSKDNRVPVDNVKWLGKMMRRCEVRVLEGEGHGLMASATVMGNVLMEIAGEWDDWIMVVKGDKTRRRT